MPAKSPCGSQGVAIAQLETVRKVARRAACVCACQKKMGRVMMWRVL